MMQSPQMQQLRQRVIASYHLGPLDKAETQAYIEHRLKHVGWKDDPRFEPACFDLIHELTGGIPRRINTICNRLLLAAYLSERHSLSTSDVQAIAQEILEEMGPESGLSPVALLGCAGGAAGEGPSAGKNRRGGLASALQPDRGADRSPGSDGCCAMDLSARAAAPGEGDEARLSDGALMSDSGSRLGPLVCIVGARPNYMKMAPLVRAFGVRSAAARGRAGSHRTALRRRDERAIVRRPRTAGARHQSRSRLRIARRADRPRSCGGSSRCSTGLSRAA